MTPRLVTIPISHFCEKARWALERAGIAFREEGHLQVLHYWAARRAGGGRTVPVLVTGDGVLQESTDILRWADRRLAEPDRLFPSDGDPRVLRSVASFEDYGADTRLWAYRHFLASPRLALRYGPVGVPAIQRLVFPLFLPVMAAAIFARYRIGKQAAAAAESRFLSVLDGVARRLSDGRPFLLGDRFTAADLTFAALSAPLALPSSYGSPIARLDEMPLAIRSRLAELQEHPAVAFALRLYRDQRRDVVAAAA